MNIKTWVPLALAVVLGVAAAMMARNYLLRNRTTATPTVKLAKVLMARQDIMPGRELKPEDVTEGKVALDSVPAGSFNEYSQLAGRVAESRMVKGQPVLEAMLAPQGAASGLQALVPKGMRAITIEVNEFSGIAGLLTPGSRVDILATLQGDGRQVARTIVQNVKVTAVGQRTVVQPKEPEGNALPQPPEITRSITLLVRLKDAEAIELAATTGRPRLVLRSSRDEDVAVSEGITIGELTGANRDGFWASAARFLAAMPRPAAGPVTGLAAANRPATRPADDVEKRMVRVIRRGAETNVTMEIRRNNTAEASGAMDATRSATGQ